MTDTVIRCDKCKDAIVENTIHVQWTAPYQQIDLCQKCNEAFKEWLNKDESGIKESDVDIFQQDL